MKNLAIYHGDCNDGFGAALVFSLANKSGEESLIKGVYGKEPDWKVLNDQVNLYLLDFSYPTEIIEKLCKTCNQVTVIDHHLTSEPLQELQIKNLCVIHSKNYSGCVLTWLVMFDSVEPPLFLRYIQDRDLWAWKLENSKEINECISSYPQSLAVWEKLLNEFDVKKFDVEGSGILRSKMQGIRSLLKTNCINLTIGGHSVKAINIVRQWASDAGNLLVEEYGQDFGATFSVVQSRVNFSLRSDDNHTDVEKIARGYGGGGHRNASGFSVSFDQFLRMVE